MAELSLMKTVIRGCLVSAPSQQLSMHELHRDYIAQEGNHIPFRDLGFNSLYDFLMSIPDTVVVSGNRSQFVIRPVHSEKSGHVESLVARQVSSKRRRGGGRYEKMPPPRRRPTYYSGVMSSKAPASWTRPNSPPMSRQAVPLVVRTPLFPGEGAAGFNLTPAVARSHASVRNSTPSPKFYEPRDMLAVVRNQPSSERKYLPAGAEDELTDLMDELHYGSDEGEAAPMKTCRPLPDGLDEDHGKELEEDNFFEPCDKSEVEEGSSLLSNSVKNNILRLLADNPNGIWCSALVDLYKDTFNENLAFQVYGFVSVLDMLQTCKKLFYCKQVDKADWMLYDARNVEPEPFIPDYIPKRVEQLLIGKPNGIDVAKFMEVYKEVFREELSLEAMHFPSVEALLDQLHGHILRIVVCDNVPRIYPLIFIPEEVRNPRPPTPEQVDPIVRRQFPADTVQLGDDFPRFRLPPEVVSNADVEVLVAAVISVDRFYVQLRSLEHSKRCDEVSDAMLVFYKQHGQRYRVPPIAAVVGLYCVAFIKDEYHRLKIMRRIDIATVSALLLDYGNCETLRIGQLYFMHRRFANVAPQAVLCRCANLRPPLTEARFSKAAGMRLLDLVQDKGIIATVCQVFPKRLWMWVSLVDTTGEEDLHINDQLVAEGHAVFCCDMLTPAIVHLTSKSDNVFEDDYESQMFWSMTSSSHLPLASQSSNNAAKPPVPPIAKPVLTTTKTQPGPLNLMAQTDLTETRSVKKEDAFESKNTGKPPFQKVYVCPDIEELKQKCSEANRTMSPLSPVPVPVSVQAPLPEPVPAPKEEQPLVVSTREPEQSHYKQKYEVPPRFGLSAEHGNSCTPEAAGGGMKQATATQPTWLNVDCASYVPVSQRPSTGPGGDSISEELAPAVEQLMTSAKVRMETGVTPQSPAVSVSNSDEDVQATRNQSMTNQYSQNIQSVLFPPPLTQTPHPLINSTPPLLSTLPFQFNGGPTMGLQMFPNCNPQMGTTYNPNFRPVQLSYAQRAAMQYPVGQHTPYYTYVQFQNAQAYLQKSQWQRDMNQGLYNRAGATSNADQTHNDQQNYTMPLQALEVNQAQQSFKVDQLQPATNTDQAQETSKVNQLESVAKIDQAEETSKVNQLEPVAKIDQAEETSKVNQLEPAAKTDHDQQVSEAKQPELFKPVAVVASSVSSNIVEVEKDFTELALQKAADFVWERPCTTTSSPAKSKKDDVRMMDLAGKSTSNMTDDVKLMSPASNMSIEDEFLCDDDLPTIRGSESEEDVRPEKCITVVEIGSQEIFLFKIDGCKYMEVKQVLGLSNTKLSLALKILKAREANRKFFDLKRRTHGYVYEELDEIDLKNKLTSAAGAIQLVPLNYVTSVLACVSVEETVVNSVKVLLSSY